MADDIRWTATKAHAAAALALAGCLFVGFLWLWGTAEQQAAFVELMLGALRDYAVPAIGAAVLAWVGAYQATNRLKAPKPPPRQAVK